MENRKWLQTYLYIWSGQFISMLTSYAVNFAIVIWLSLEHSSAEVLAIAAVLPTIIGLLFTGRIAETIGVANSFLISGVVVVLIGVLSFFDLCIDEEWKQNLNVK